ncbi:alpha/beta-hydrolase [Zalerion maritima]|uniref:Alpha/beta-hydrolase n=1 Tax=Zalerion maritima TaxID=339359 RepID=A0AAD5RQX5_9PEZI|nr:alpha/beta-hydrolase [Zalerion maritima]
MSFRVEEVRIVVEESGRASRHCSMISTLVAARSRCQFRHSYHFFPRSSLLVLVLVLVLVLLLLLLPYLETTLGGGGGRVGGGVKAVQPQPHARSPAIGAAWNASSPPTLDPPAFSCGTAPPPTAGFLEQPGRRRGLRGHPPPGSTIPSICLWDEPDHRDQGNFGPQQLHAAAAGRPVPDPFVPYITPPKRFEKLTYVR